MARKLAVSAPKSGESDKIENVILMFLYTNVRL